MWLVHLGRNHRLNGASVIFKSLPEPCNGIFAPLSIGFVANQTFDGTVDGQPWPTKKNFGHSTSNVSALNHTDISVVHKEKSHSVAWQQLNYFCSKPEVVKQTCHSITHSTI